MDNLINVQINLMSFAVYAILLYNIRTSKKKLQHQQKFVKLLVSLSATSLMEALSWMIDGKIYPSALPISLLINSIYSFASIYPSYCWYVYTEAVLNIKEKQYSIIIRKIMLYFLYCLVGVIILNLFYPILFKIDENMMYQRQSMFTITFILANSYLVLPMVVATLKMKTLKTYFQKRECRLIIYFSFLPFSATVLQSLNYGYSLIWPFTSMSILMFYLNNDNKYIGVDKLTGLYNKEVFDLYTNEKQSHIIKNMHLAVILIHVDNFKTLNDMYGYIEGDKILSRVAKMLRIATSETDAFCARVKGDNFCIIWEVSDTSDLFDLIDQIKLREKYYKSKYYSEYDLKLNIGYSISEKNWPINMADLLSIANREMHNDKYAKLRIRTN